MWIFPPGVSGWMGLTDLTLGYDIEGSAKQASWIHPALENYVEKVSGLPGAEPVERGWASGYHLNPDTVVRHRHQIADILAGLVQRVSEEA